MGNEFTDMTLNFGQLDIEATNLDIAQSITVRVEMRHDNPTSGILIIEIPTEFERVKAQLTDVTGRIVLPQDELQGIATLNMRQLAPGSYTFN